MRLEEINLNCFRNIAAANIKPAPHVNLILGDNAQGKTNLLEAIYVFTGQGSFRAIREREMIMNGQKRAKAEIIFEGGGRDNSAEIILGENRSCRLNGVLLDTPGALMGKFLSVVFSPGHLSLIKDGPALRRAFLDEAISQLKPHYAHLLARYNRILSQRAALLRDAGLHPALLDTLDVWDQSLVRLGALVTKTRESYVEKIGAAATKYYASMTSGREELRLSYTRSYSSGSNVEDAIAQALLENRASDIKSGRTGAGPHRDDLNIEIDSLAARSYGSQGQQRSAVICLKLAEASLMTQISGDEPVVLLDDVLSELDQSRREYLLSGLRGRQVFITCCEREAFSSSDDYKIFTVRGGVISS